MSAINSGDWSDDTIKTLDEAIAKFKGMFLATEDDMHVHEAPAEALEGEGAETVTKVVPSPKKK